VNLAAIDSAEYMSPIEAATRDKPVQIVFSNAGYIVSRAFAKTELRVLQANWACNITSHIAIAHHFMRLMQVAPALSSSLFPPQVNGLRGGLVFTSSHVAFMPALANCLYGTAKAALSQLGACLALEGAAYGIDVLVVQTGPMATAFTANLAPLDAVKSFYRLASTPEQVASVMCRSLGRIAVRDHALPSASCCASCCACST
jgi:short-subunit dehydrogenase